MTMDFRMMARAICMALVGIAALPVAAQQAQRPPAPAPAARPPAAATVGTEQNEYRLGASDVIRVNVYQNPDLTLEGLRLIYERNR